MLWLRLISSEAPSDANRSRLEQLVGGTVFRVQTLVCGFAYTPRLPQPRRLSLYSEHL